MQILRSKRNSSPSSACTRAVAWSAYSNFAAAATTVPASLDPSPGGVSSKDVAISPNVSVRLYLPNTTNPADKGSTSWTTTTAGPSASNSRSLPSTTRTPAPSRRGPTPSSSRSSTASLLSTASPSPTTTRGRPSSGRSAPTRTSGWSSAGMRRRCSSRGTARAPTSPTTPPPPPRSGGYGSRGWSWCTPTSG
ncbi:putative tuliposide A-converting enzyme 1, chloroplastic [Iris pallida]|uniref:Tuliposide A-converting enzyme 1, chloroplastic n=1 Tax=Iris pallida TaxID=29817 RepID=A0AAX6GNB5_IRIPA|nr:putative tuliposide A-converting enzyme 1, chloroplastic [Iris pallida]